MALGVHGLTPVLRPFGHERAGADVVGLFPQGEGLGSDDLELLVDLAELGLQTFEG